MEINQEEKYKIKTNKNNEMELYIKNINDEKLSIILYSIEQTPSKKYELTCTLEDFQRNRFFKIFRNVEEIKKELENKIKKSTFIEETNSIIMDIQIGLTIINEILLELEEKEKNKDEIINELTKTIDKLKKNLTEKNKIIENKEKYIKKLEEEIGLMSSKSFSKINQHFKEEIIDNSRIYNCNTVLGVDINHLEEFMDSIFSEEVSNDFSDAMKSKLRVIKFSDRADNFKGKDIDTGLDSNSFKCNNISHYFFFIAEKKENKMDISYKLFCGRVEIYKAYDINKGERKIDNKNVNYYRYKLKEIVNNPLCLESIESIKKDLWTNILNERKKYELK